MRFLGVLGGESGEFWGVIYGSWGFREFYGVPGGFGSSKGVSAGSGSSIGFLGVLGVLWGFWGSGTSIGFLGVLGLKVLPLHQKHLSLTETIHV